jgi:hypothetical protein
MIRSHRALLRHGQEFFLRHMVGVYDWGDVLVDAPDLMPAAERRDAGVGKFRERERLVFGPWEILISSSHDKPPLGEVSLRQTEWSTGVLVVGPLDPETWSRIATHIRNASHSNRKAS